MFDFDAKALNQKKPYVAKPMQCIFVPFVLHSCPQYSKYAYISNCQKSFREVFGGCSWAVLVGRRPGARARARGSWAVARGSWASRPRARAGATPGDRAPPPKRQPDGERRPALVLVGAGARGSWAAGRPARRDGPASRRRRRGSWAAGALARGGRSRGDGGRCSWPRAGDQPGEPARGRGGGGRQPGPSRRPGGARAGRPARRPAGGRLVARGRATARRARRVRGSRRGCSWRAAGGVSWRAAGGCSWASGGAATARATDRRRPATADRASRRKPRKEKARITGPSGFTTIPSADPTA